MSSGKRTEGGSLECAYEGPFYLVSRTRGAQAQSSAEDRHKRGEGWLVMKVWWRISTLWDLEALIERTSGVGE